MKIILCIISVLIFCISTDYFPQSTNDTINKPIQFRRCAEIPSGYQSYEERYRGKSLQEEKRKFYPIDQITTGTGIWTELNPKIPRVTYAGIYFVNKDTGWAVGDLGTLIKTIDGGESWRIIETNTTKPLLKIRSYNGLVVIASGYDGLILRSTDGGETFSQVPSGAGEGFDLWGLEMVNDTLGWACGATALLKTTDSGQNWQIANIPGYTDNLWWIDFMNENYGFIAADGKVLRTSDGGNNWDIIQAGDNQPLYCVDVIDSLHIAAGGYGGTDYSAKNIYSNDGGNTWINGGNLSTENVNSLQYINPDTGYIVMSGVSGRKTTNRGQEWTTLQGISDNYEIQLLSEKLGYSAGTEAKISKAEENLDIWHRLIVNDNFSDVFFVNEQKGFVISSAGNSNYRGLYSTTNSGETWQYISGAPDGVEILFLDSLTGFIGASSTIYKTTDGGDNWYQTQGTYGAGKIFFINQTTGWAIHSNVIYKTTDRGENWFIQLNAPLSTGFYSIYFVDSLYGWTANSGRPFKTTDGGNNWIQQTNLDIWQSDDVYFANRDVGWIIDATSWSTLKKTINGGTTWITISEIIDPINFNFFPDPIHWIIQGSHRYITTNSGSGWIEITNDVPTGFTRFQAPTNLLGYAAGDYGLILKYVDTVYTPVELTGFSANLDGQNILLKWITATESNNKGFEVERHCLTGCLHTDETKEWEKIGFVEGNGTTTRNHFYIFTDNNVLPGKYKYRLKQIDYDGSYEYNKEVEVEVNNPKEFYLGQNYPNPFNPVSQINYQIPVKGFVSLKVYDTLGEEVATLVNEEKSAGSYEVKFDGSDLSSGVYIYRLVVEKFVEFKKMIIIK